MILNMLFLNNQHSPSPFNTKMGNKTIPVIGCQLNSVVLSFLNIGTSPDDDKALCLVGPFSPCRGGHRGLLLSSVISIPSMSSFTTYVSLWGLPLGSILTIFCPAYPRSLLHVKAISTLLLSLCLQSAQPDVLISNSVTPDDLKSYDLQLQLYLVPLCYCHHLQTHTVL